MMTKWVLVAVMVGAMGAGPATRPAATQASAGRTTLTPAGLIAMLPKEYLPTTKVASEWPRGDHVRAERALREKLVGQSVEITLPAHAAQPKGPKKWMVYSGVVRVPVNKTSLGVSAYYEFDEDSPILAKLREGQTLTVSGEIKTVQVGTLSSHTGVHLVLQSCEAIRAK